MGHADFSEHDLELYADGQDDPTEVVGLDDAVLPAALDAFAELLCPEEGARLVVDLGGRTSVGLAPRRPSAIQGPTALRSHAGADGRAEECKYRYGAGADPVAGDRRPGPERPWRATRVASRCAR